MELQEALLALLTKLPELHLAGDVEWHTRMLNRSARYLPVGW